MPALKYWDGSAWQPTGIGAGGTPTTVQNPSKGQLGSIFQLGTVGLNDVNAGAGGIYNISPNISPAAQYGTSTFQLLIGTTYAGFSSGDVLVAIEIMRLRDNTSLGGAPGYPLTHGQYWMPNFFVAWMATGPGGVDNSSYTRLHYGSGPAPVHTSGAVGFISGVF
jgi:hypothetical protein